MSDEQRDAAHGDALDDVYYTIDEVAKQFKVTRQAVYNWMNAGDLAYVRVGAHRRVTRRALAAFVRAGVPGDAAGDSKAPVPMPVMA